MDEPQTAMLLTDQEWQDLSRLVAHARECCSFGLCSHNTFPTNVVERLRALADRIVEAAGNGRSEP